LASSVLVIVMLVVALLGYQALAIKDSLLV
jgi:hypothetical protein